MSNVIFVTGASGTIGRELVQQLKKSRAQIIAGVSTTVLDTDVETRQIDFTNPVTLQTAFSGVDTLFLLLPLKKNMVEMAGNVIEAAKRAGVRFINHSSAAGANAASSVAIARVHGEIDQLVIRSGISYTITRPSNFMQNYINYYGEMIRGGTMYLPQGEGKMSLIDVRDVAAVNAVILQNPTVYADQIYTLTGAESLSNYDVATTISKLANKRITYVPVTEEAAIKSMKEMRVEDWNIHVLMSLNRIISAGYLADTTNDVSNILSRPPIKFTQFVKDHINSWK